jgi:putative hydroxymethylpyrimidine transporter CytX
MESAGKGNGRNLNSLDMAILWFGAAVVVTELWGGIQVTPAGLGIGVAMIVVGRLLSNLFLGLVSRMGTRTGLPTMLLTRPAFGVKGSIIPAVCNVLQLLGWTAYMLIVAAQSGVYLVGLDEGSESYSRFFFLSILLVGVLTTLWAVLGHRWWKTAQRIAVGLLLLLTVVMTWAVLREHTIGGLLAVPRPEGMSPMLLLDFVVAMGISWVPLAADYGRFATSERASFAGTYWGYFAGSAWMYIVGLIAGLAFLANSPDTPVYALDPNVVVLGTLKPLKMVFAGLLLVLISTITTTFLDIYSAAVSATAIFPKTSEKWFGVAAGVLGTILAFFIDMEQYQGFLLLIGVVFLPMFSIVAVDWLFLRKGRVDVEAVNAGAGTLYWYRGGFNPTAVIAWIAGMGISLWAQDKWWLAEVIHQVTGREVTFGAPWAIGSAIPCFILTSLIYLALNFRRLRKSQG